MGLREHFDVVAGPALRRRAEDKTQTLGRALRLLGPTRAVMVGDRSFDIVAARAHGLPSIGVTWGIGTRGGAGRQPAPTALDRRIRSRELLPRRQPDRCPARKSSRPRQVLAVFTLYSISLWLHISAAIVGLGATFALAVGFPLALKLDARYLPFVHHLSLDVNRKLASPALLVLIITGIYQAIDGDSHRTSPGSAARS